MMTVLTAKIIWALGVIGWFVIRYPHQRRSARTPVARAAGGTRDRILLAISTTGLGIVPGVFVATGLPAFADYPFSPLQGWLGLALFAAALVLFRLTHKRLGRNWSVSLDTREDHRLITDGVYTYVRHPMYSAFFLWALAQFALLPNWIAGPAGLVGFGILYFNRVGREERLMVETFGEEYRRYQQHTKRVIPGIL